MHWTSFAGKSSRVIAKKFFWGDKNSFIAINVLEKNKE